MFALPVYAWDTATKDYGEEYDWRSIYVSQVLHPGGKVSIHGNEHAEISAMALVAIGAGKLLDTQSTPMVVDINASYFHHDILPEQRYAPADAPDDALERRLLPPPSQFSGIPDFSYTLYDWINKNALCPVLPPNAKSVKQCHAYKGWLGAGLNASHFGTQAALNYKRLHQLALSIADLTRSIRLKLAQTPGALDAYQDYIREGEWMALAYEGFASHFMADRWSTGHMWERWNSGDYEHLATTELMPNQIIGYISGLVHGWEPGLHGVKLMSGEGPLSGKGISHRLLPDPLAAPWIETQDRQNVLSRAWRYWYNGEAPKYSITKIKPSLWRHSSNNIFQPGIGDDLLKNMFDGRFGKQYGSMNSLPLNVPTQKQEMMECVEAGWVETIQALGKNGQGSYGVENIPLNSNAPTFKSLTHGCFDQFVTNQSIANAWPFSQPGFWSKLGRSTLLVGSNTTVQKSIATLFPLETAAIKLSAGPDQLNLYNHFGKMLVRISARIWAQSKLYPNGIQLATAASPGGLGPIEMKPLPQIRGGTMAREIYWQGSELPKYAAYPGSEYGAASYLPPDDEAGLPDKDDKEWRGRDLETVYGFFSKAGAYHWCNILPDLLPRLRGGDNDRDHAVCEYLADFAYQGTEPDYHGPQAELRTTTFKRGATQVPSFCAALGIPSTDAVPKYLQSGYVRKPYQRAADNLTYSSISDWCDQVPVLDLLTDEDQMNRDMVAEVNSGSEVFTMHGADLGDETGKLLIDCNMPMVVDEWQDNLISAHLPEPYLENNGLHTLCVRSVNNGSSVGHFMLDVQIEQTALVGTVIEDGGSPVSGAVVSVEINSKAYSGASGPDGVYQVNIPRQVNVPGALIVTASRAGYNTGSAAAGKQHMQGVDITLSKASINTIQIDPSLHHLGNSNYQGTINSQFQRPQAEGAVYQNNFDIQAAQIPSGNTSAEIVLMAKGSENVNPVFINDTQIGGLGTTNGDGSASQVTIDFDVCALRYGNNLIKIQSQVEADDIDDFEFANIQLVLKPKQYSPQKDKSLVKLSTIRVTGQDFITPLSSIDTKGSFWISAEGESACATLKDMAEVVVYPYGSDAAQGIRVKLLETGPNTSEFHSLKPVTAASIHARTGQKIIIRSGLRGATLRITDSSGSSKPSQKISSPPQRPAAQRQVNGSQAATPPQSSANTVNGAGNAGAQVVIPSQGGASGKQVGAAVKKAPSTKQTTAKTGQWETFKLQTFASSRAGGIPKIKVIKIAFKRSPNLVQLLVKSYPLSLTRDDQTGKILWSVNWSNGDIQDQQMSSNPPTMDMLQQKADGMRQGTVSKSGLEALINSQLGPNARHL